MENQNKTNWWAIGCAVMLVIILIMIFFRFNSTAELESKDAQLEKDIKIKTDSLTSLKSELKKKQPVLDSLKKKLDSTKLAKRDNQVKINHDEKIHKINLYYPSDQQRYFDSVAIDWIHQHRKEGNNTGLN